MYTVEKTNTVLPKNWSYETEEDKKERTKGGLPSVDMTGAILLSIGCRNGKELHHPEFETVSERHGIDVDEVALQTARRSFPECKFMRGKAECLPYEVNQFTHVICRVTLPYTHIPTSIKEIRRVLQPGGHLFLTMHDMRMQLGWLSEAIRSRSWVRVADHAYIFTASLIYALTGRCVARLRDGTIETFQTQWQLRRQLRKAGFKVTRMERTRHIEIEAIRI